MTLSAAHPTGGYLVALVSTYPLSQSTRTDDGRRAGEPFTAVESRSR